MGSATAKVIAAHSATRSLNSRRLIVYSRPVAASISARLSALARGQAADAVEQRAEHRIEHRRAREIGRVVALQGRAVQPVRDLQVPDVQVQRLVLERGVVHPQGQGSLHDHDQNEDGAAQPRAPRVGPAGASPARWQGPVIRLARPLAAGSGRPVAASGDDIARAEANITVSASVRWKFGSPARRGRPCLGPAAGRDDGAFRSCRGTVISAERG